MQGAEWAKNTTYVHRLETDFARAWVVHRARQADGLEALTLLQSADWSPFDEVLLADPVQDVPEVMAESRGVVGMVYAPEEIAVQVDLATAGWLVLGEWHYPGWRVWVDGVEKPLLRANYGLRAVALASGPHEVVFRFRPTSVYVGAAVSATMVAVLLVLFVLSLRRRRNWGKRVGA